MEIQLSHMVVGSQGTVCKINAEGKVRRRLFDMGVTPGALVVIRKRAPLGDPIEVTIRGYELTLRNVEADEIIVNIEEA